MTYEQAPDELQRLVIHAMAMYYKPEGPGPKKLQHRPGPEDQMRERLDGLIANAEDPKAARAEVEPPLLALLRDLRP